MTRLVRLSLLPVLVIVAGVISAYSLAATPKHDGRLGDIAGHLTIAGGPRGYGPRQASGRVLLIVNGRPITSRRFASHAGYHLRVHPGIYQLAAITGTLQCQHQGFLRVRPGHRVLANIICHLH